MNPLLHLMGLCLGVVLAGTGATLQAAGPTARVDHLVYATPDLDRGIAELEQRLGVRAVFGGQHPGRGTRNALIALGPTCYLEIIAPDPEQPPRSSPLPYGVDSLTVGGLAGWAANSADLDHLRRDALAHGIPFSRVQPGSRRRPDGVVLSWRLAGIASDADDCTVPFFIDWGESPHPAQNAPKGAVLVELRVEHPDAENTRRLFSPLGLEVPVGPGATPALVAILDTPRGRVELR